MAKRARPEVERRRLVGDRSSTATAVLLPFAKRAATVCASKSHLSDPMSVGPNKPESHTSYKACRIRPFSGLKSTHLRGQLSASILLEAPGAYNTFHSETLQARARIAFLRGFASVCCLTLNFRGR